MDFYIKLTFGYILLFNLRIGEWCMRKRSIFNGITRMVIVIGAVIIISLSLSFNGCTMSKWNTITRNFAAENGKIMREVTVKNGRTDKIIWRGIGIMNLENSDNGDYEIMTWHETGEITRDLFNGRDNYIHVHDMTVEENKAYREGRYVSSFINRGYDVLD
jgi:hypothetical protein